jgi:hypothetical protein
VLVGLQHGKEYAMTTMTMTTTTILMIVEKKIKFGKMLV